jgi:hypothetical protein
LPIAGEAQGFPVRDQNSFGVPKGCLKAALVASSSWMHDFAGVVEKVNNFKMDGIFASDRYYSVKIAFRRRIRRSISGRGRRKVNMTFHILKGFVPKQLTGSWRYPTIPPN